MNRKTRGTIVGILMACAATVAWANCYKGAVNCTMGTAAMTTCFATAACSNAPIADIWTIVPLSSTNVTSCYPATTILSGSVVTFTLIARATSAAPATRSCKWNWRSLSYSAGGSLALTGADGLPVELLELEID